MLVFLIPYHREHSCYEWPSPSFLFKLYAVTLIIDSTGIKIPFLNDNCIERKLLLRRHQMVSTAAFTFNAAFMIIVDIGIVFKARIVRIQASLKALYTYTNKRSWWWFSCSVRLKWRMTFSEGMEQVLIFGFQNWNNYALKVDIKLLSQSQSLSA